MKKGKGIYSIETVWFEEDVEPGLVKPDTTSIRPMLNMLRDSYLDVPVVHRDVATKEEFKFYIKKWCSYPMDYPILHIGIHGVRNGLELYDGSIVELSEVSNWIKSRGVSCKDCVVHFSSCSSLLGEFFTECEFSAVSGYTKKMYPVMEAWPFEIIYLGLLQGNRRLTTNRLQHVKDKLSKPPYEELMRHLRFELQVSNSS